jgi:hypothetical protein
MPEDASRRWMTYAEIATALDLPSAKAGEAKARRAKWERTLGNDGLARVAVPLSVLEEPHPPRRPDAEGRRRPAEGPAQAAVVSALVAELKAGHEQALGEMRRRAEAAEARAARAEAAAAEMPELRERAGRAEGEAASLRNLVDVERARATRAEAQRDEARIGRAAAEASRIASDLEARAELAGWTAGGPLARAWRALLNRRRRA